MKVILTNKADPTIKAEYINPLNISVQQYINPENGYDGSPMWVLQLGSRYDNGHASFHCAEWSIDVI